MRGDIQAIKQRLADGGSHELVSELEKASTPAAVAAQMTVIKGQIALEAAQGKKPNEKKIEAISPALLLAAKRYPEVSETWSAVSTLVSYRTSSVVFPRELNPDSLPDCDVDKEKTTFLPQTYGFPPSAMGYEEGYLFRDCRLYLDRLPGHRKTFTILPDPNSPNPNFRQGGPAAIVYPAYALNVVIVWRGNFSDNDILSLTTLNCKFQFAVNDVPNRQGQNLLLAALQNPLPGSGFFDLRKPQTSYGPG